MATRGPGKELARVRKEWLSARDRAHLQQLREQVASARARRNAALRAAMKACSRARRSLSEKVRAYRSEQMKRINAEVREMRNRARAQCQARQHRIRGAGGHAVDRRSAELRNEARLRQQLARVDAKQRNRHMASRRERLEEDDDAVRSNLPPELLPAFERVRKHIKASKRTTRTEAFLEWAESHPEDVIAYQGDATDRELRRLIAEHEATERQLRKTRPRSTRRRAGGSDEVPF
ncbi:MAG: hypothetical protein ABW217_02975 [Polyangiaceae bacterium]